MSERASRGGIWVCSRRSDSVRARQPRSHADEAVVLFQREAVGLPAPVIEQIRSSPMFASLASLAQSAVYDALLASITTPTGSGTCLMGL